MLVPPGTKLDRQMYLNLLGDRVRELVMADDDPQAAVARLVRALESAGLWSDQVNVTPETVGSVLVESNPQLWERLGILLEKKRRMVELAFHQEAHPLAHRRDVRLVKGRRHMHKPVAAIQLEGGLNAHNSHPCR